MKFSPGQNTGVGSFSHLQRIFPTQESNPGLPHCRWIFYQLSHKRSPRIPKWVAYPFSSRSSQPRSWTSVSCNCRWILYQLSYGRKPCFGWWSSECVPEPAASASPEFLREVQVLGLHPDLLTHPPPGQDPALSFNKPSGGPEAHSDLRLQFISANHPNLSLSPSNNCA